MMQIRASSIEHYQTDEFKIHESEDYHSENN